MLFMNTIFSRESKLERYLEELCESCKKHGRDKKVLIADVSIVF
jgi:creatinine amidohydrolase/Fe(II)-dependent formamide hydrolase-like protein